MNKCEWCDAHLSGHRQSGKVKPVEIAADLFVTLCAKCCKEAQQIDEVLSQEDAGEHLTTLIPSLPEFPTLVWENGR
jgi:hypothetical protein